MLKTVCLVAAAIIITVIGTMWTKPRSEPEVFVPTTMSKEACYQLFKDILEVQKKRDVIREDFNLIMTDYSFGRVSQEKFESEKKRWVEKEGELRTYVTNLYDIGYVNDCFTPPAKVDRDPMWDRNPMWAR